VAKNINSIDKNIVESKKKLVEIELQSKMIRQNSLKRNSGELTIQPITLLDPEHPYSLLQGSKKKLKNALNLERVFPINLSYSSPETQLKSSKKR